MENMKRFKAGLTLRGDHYYCPLALQLSTYWNCEARCVHCWLRKMNRTWGEDLRPLDLDVFLKQVEDGIKREEPKSSLAWAIKQKKTVYIGAKSDAYQDAELEWGVTKEALQILLHYGFSIVIATMFTANVFRDINILAKYKDKVTILPIVSPGIDKDWEVFERKRTTKASQRIKDAVEFQKMGFKVGINGEPFILGYHTLNDFENILNILKDYEIKSYNIYKLHLNDWNLKEMKDVGIDIDIVYRYNGPGSDVYWRNEKLVDKIVQMANKAGIVLGCPDFVNTGDYVTPTNTCCGVDVPNPCRFNVITWKQLRAMGLSDEEILKDTWDNVGDYEKGKTLLTERSNEFFTMENIYDEGLLL